MKIFFFRKIKFDGYEKQEIKLVSPYKIIIIIIIIIINVVFIKDLDPHLYTDNYETGISFHPNLCYH